MSLVALTPKDHPGRIQVADLLESLAKDIRDNTNVSGVFLILTHADGMWNEHYTGEIKMTEMLGFLERAKRLIMRKLDK